MSYTIQKYFDINGKFIVLSYSVHIPVVQGVSS